LPTPRSGVGLNELLGITLEVDLDHRMAFPGASRRQAFDRNVIAIGAKLCLCLQRVSALKVAASPLIGGDALPSVVGTSLLLAPREQLAC